MTKAKRGRPLSVATLEMQRIAEMLSNRPPHLPHICTDKINEIEKMLTSMKEAKIDILKTFKYGQWTPDEHAFRMASIGDELFNEDHVKKIIEDDEKFEGRAKRIRKKAGDKNHIKSKNKKDRVLEINKILIAQMNKSKKLKPHNIAEKIYEQWYSMNPEQRLFGEPLYMQCRGDGGKLVSVRTIERWLKSIV